MSEEQRRAAEQIAEILRPLRDLSHRSYEEDRVGPDDAIREVVRDALAQLVVDGLGGCRLCLS